MKKYLLIIVSLTTFVINGAYPQENLINNHHKSTSSNPMDYQEHKIISDPNNQVFGPSIAVDGTLAATAINNQIAIYRYADSSWYPIGKAYVADNYSDIGNKILLDDDHLFFTVTDSGDNDSYKVLVYEKFFGNWRQSAVLSAPHGINDEFFGHSGLTYANGQLFVSALSDKSVIGYKKLAENWGINAILQSSISQNPNQYGSSIDFDGQHLMVGAPPSTDSADIGQVFVYTSGNEGWQETQILSNPSGTANQQLGQALAVEGNLLVASVPGDSGSGAIYTFKLIGNTWTQTDIIEALNPQQSSLLGSDLTLVNGSIYATGHTQDLLYIFNETEQGWLEQSLAAINGTQSSQYNTSSFSIDDDRLIMLHSDLIAIEDSEFNLFAHSWKSNNKVWQPEEPLTVRQRYHYRRMGNLTVVDKEFALVTNGFWTPETDITIYQKTDSIWIEQQKLSLVNQTRPFAISPKGVDMSNKKVAVAGYIQEVFGAGRDQVVMLEYLDNKWVETQRLDRPFFPNVQAREFATTVVSLDKQQMATSGFALYYSSYPYALPFTGPLPPPPVLEEVAGQVFIYEYIDQQWQLEHVINKPDDFAFDLIFGKDIDLFGDHMVITSSSYTPHSNDPAPTRVDYYHKENDQWTWQQKLEPSIDVTASDRFGDNISLSNHWIAITDPENSTFGEKSGAVYLYHINEDHIDAQHYISAPMPQLNGYFGHDVSLYDHKLLVGAVGHDQLVTPYEMNTGSAFLFDLALDGSKLINEYQPQDAMADHQFGYAVSFDGANALVSAINDNDNGHLAGAAYVFTEEVIFNSRFE